MSSSDPSQTSLPGGPLAGKLAGPVLKVDADGKSTLQLYISPPGPEQIRMIGVHGPSGCGKSTSEIDILLHACEEGWVAGLASNIEVNNIPYTYQHLDYLTDLINIRKVGLGLDELNSCLDGWSWKEEMHQKFAHIVDQSRRRECSVLVATSIRETGVSSHLRRSITMVIAPLGKMTTDGYPIYAVFSDYWAYSQYLAGNPKAPYTVCYGFHKVADLKQVFDSMKEPKLLPYPPSMLGRRHQSSNCGLLRVAVAPFCTTGRGSLFN